MIYSQRCIAIFHQRCCLNDTKTTNIWWIIDTKNSLWNLFIYRILNQMNDKLRKITELLCEYEKTKENHLRWFIEYLVWWWYRFMYYDFTKSWNVKEILAEDEAVSKAISQSYWFIEWLCREWKIDKEKMRYVINNYFDQKYFWFATYEYITMLLSIQDKPFELLSLILK